MKIYPKEELIIQGHTCTIQKDSIQNHKLSIKCALSVRQYLEKKGVAKGRVKIEGYGDTQPEWGRMKNRRGVLERKKISIIKF